MKLRDPGFAALGRQKQFTFLHPSGHLFVNPKTGELWKGDASYRMTIWAPAIKRAGADIGIRIRAVTYMHLCCNGRRKCHVGNEAVGTYRLDVYRTHL